MINENFRSGRRVRGGSVWLVILMVCGVVGASLYVQDKERRLDERRKQVVGCPPLHQAIALGDLKLARKLLDAGEDPDGADARGNRPLHWVDSSQAVQLLVEYSADMNLRNDEGETALFTVGNVGALRTMVKHGADVKERDHSYETPLHDAKNVAAARYFVKLGLDVNEVDRRGHTALHSAQSRGIAEFLVGRGASLSAVNRQGLTVMHLARNPKIAAFFIEQGVSVKPGVSGGVLPIHCARSAGMIRYWASKGQSVDARSRHDAATPLMMVREVNCAQALIELGADLELKNSSGMTALLRAVISCPEIVPTLIEAGADVSDPMLMQYAVSQGRSEVVDHLISAGASIGGLRVNLSWDEKMVRLLLASGAPPDADTLAFASPAVIDLVIAAGVDVNHRNSRGETALFCFRSWETVGHLLFVGADPMEVNQTGLTAMDVWVQYRYDEIAIGEQLRQVLSAHADVIDLDALLDRADMSWVPVLMELGGRPTGEEVLARALVYSQREESAELIASLLEGGAKLGECEHVLRHLDFARLSIEVLELLRKYGIELKFSGHNLMALGRCRDVEVARALLLAGAPVDGEGSWKEHPIHTTWGVEGVFELLLDAGADVNAIDSYGSTPLHRVLRTKNASGKLNDRQRVAIRRLIEGGADLGIRDRSGKSARDLISREELENLMLED